MTWLRQVIGMAGCPRSLGRIAVIDAYFTVPKVQQFVPNTSSWNPKRYICNIRTYYIILYEFPCISEFSMLVNWNNLRLRLEYCILLILSKDSFFLSPLWISLVYVSAKVRILMNITGLCMNVSLSTRNEPVLVDWPLQRFCGCCLWVNLAAIARLRWVERPLRLTKQSTVAQFPPQSISLPATHYIPDICVFEGICGSSSISTNLYMYYVYPIRHHYFVDHHVGACSTWVHPRSRVSCAPAASMVPGVLRSWLPSNKW